MADKIAASNKYSLSFIFINVVIALTFEHMFFCESSTALETPVVPDVNITSGKDSNKPIKNIAGKLYFSKTSNASSDQLLYPSSKVRSTFIFVSDNFPFCETPKSLELKFQELEEDTEIPFEEVDTNDFGFEDR